MSTADRHNLIFKALADHRRRAILDLLKRDAKTTGDICKHFQKLDRCTVMQHLRVLEQADLVIVKRDGRNRWNYLNALPMKEIYDRWISSHAEGAVNLLAQMKRDLEKGR